MSTRKLAKPQPSTSRHRKSSATSSTSAASSTSGPSTSNGKRSCRAPDYYRFESSGRSVSDQNTAPITALISKQQWTTNPVIKTLIQEEATQLPLVETSFELPVVSPPESDALQTPLRTTSTTLLRMSGRSVWRFLAQWIKLKTFSKNSTNNSISIC